MSNFIQLKKLKTDCAEIKGSDLSIEDLMNGRIYLTKKSYLDKLFKAVGYRSLNVVKILEEFAGRTINKVGDLKDCDIFIDEYSDTFIVTRQSSIDWVNSLYDYLKKNNHQIIQYRKYDDYYVWDQLWIKSTTGTYFALYIDLLDECVYCLSLNYSPSSGLKGVINEGKYEFSAEDSFDSLVTLISNSIDISYYFDLSQKLSYREFIDLFKLLGYVKKSKRMMCLTDEGENLCSISSKYNLSFVERILDDYNEMTWIKRCINSPGVTFNDVCELITGNLDRISFWDFKYLFDLNSKETSDLISLNS